MKILQLLSFEKFTYSPVVTGLKLHRISSTETSVFLNIFKLFTGQKYFAFKEKSKKILKFSLFLQYLQKQRSKILEHGFIECRILIAFMSLWANYFNLWIIKIRMFSYTTIITKDRWSHIFLAGNVPNDWTVF